MATAFRGGRSRLKIQAGCRPARHTLPDPKDLDPLWNANSKAGCGSISLVAGGFKGGDIGLHRIA
jgi:hypothetical protein